MRPLRRQRPSATTPGAARTPDGRAAVEGWGSSGGRAALVWESAQQCSRQASAEAEQQLLTVRLERRRVRPRLMRVLHAAVRDSVARPGGASGPSVRSRVNIA